jgi:serine/threonine protein kinase
VSDPRLRELLERYVELHVAEGRRPDLAALCHDAPELIEPLREQVRSYERLDETLAMPAATMPAAEAPARLPEFEGFRTIERLGRGGAGEVFKLEDLSLGRFVAAKVIHEGGTLRPGIDAFLAEARSMALFEDPRIVTVYEFRGGATPPALLMEFVDGFELGRIGRSLEFAQRARIVVEIADAIDRAHRLGVQHRDLKPSNVMLDASLSPKILDFGLSRGEPHAGHGVGTPAYMAPEQLDPALPIDARTDVYALGVMLYELLCGELPFRGRDTDALVEAIRSATPRLPAEVDPDVPEPLQAIALKAMEREPERRYASARELAADLRRFLDARPVLARPTLYQSALERRVQPHLQQIREWLRLRLIHPHEAQRLEHAYEGLRASEDDWIVGGRSFSLSQIALYLGVLLLIGGSLLYVTAWFLDAVEGWLPAMAVLALPFVALEFAARRLEAQGRRPVAVAFLLAALPLLPLFLLILLEEAGLWPADPENTRELFGEGLPSNRQLQIATFVAAMWAAWLARRTRTVTLGTAFTVLLFLFNLAVLADLGLREWLEEATFDLLATRHLPLLAVLGLLGYAAERRAMTWLARPLYFAGIGLFVAVVELLALDGKAFAYLGLTMAPFQPAEVSSPTLLDTVAAMTINGLLIYGLGWILEHRGSALMRRSAWLPYVIAPFAVLHPLSHLVAVGEYSMRYDWLYLALALTITLLSHYRQRRSFYFAGLLNTTLALWHITDHNDWFDKPTWSITVAATGLAVLATGLALYLRERRT